jgi:hypothetical protein
MWIDRSKDGDRSECRSGVVEGSGTDFGFRFPILLLGHRSFSWVLLAFKQENNDSTARDGAAAAHGVPPIGTLGLVILAGRIGRIARLGP